MIVCLLLLLVTRSDRPVEFFNLILASLDRQSSNVVVLGQRTQQEILSDRTI